MLTSGAVGAQACDTSFNHSETWCAVAVAVLCTCTCCNEGCDGVCGSGYILDCKGVASALGVFLALTWPSAAGIVLVFAVGAAFTTVMELAIIQVAALLLTSRDAMEFAIRAKPMIALESAMELPM